MKRYFNQNCDGAVRIAVVEADDDEGFSGFNRSDEIEEVALPSDFTSWKRYTAYSHGDNIVRVLSHDGD